MNKDYLKIECLNNLTNIDSSIEHYLLKLDKFPYDCNIKSLDNESLMKIIDILNEIDENYEKLYKIIKQHLT